MVRVYGNVSKPEDLPDDELMEIFRQVEYVREQELKKQKTLWGM